MHSTDGEGSFYSCLPAACQEAPPDELVVKSAGDTPRSNLGERRAAERAGRRGLLVALVRSLQGRRPLRAAAGPGKRRRAGGQGGGGGRGGGQRCAASSSIVSRTWSIYCAFYFWGVGMPCPPRSVRRATHARAQKHPLHGLCLLPPPPKIKSPFPRAAVAWVPPGAHLRRRRRGRQGPRLCPRHRLPDRRPPGQLLHAGATNGGSRCDKWSEQ